MRPGVLANPTVNINTPNQALTLVPIAILFSWLSILNNNLSTIEGEVAAVKTGRDLTNIK
jgi:hypothetical protein